MGNASLASFHRWLGNIAVASHWLDRAAHKRSMREEICHHQRVAFVFIGGSNKAKHIAAIGFQFGFSLIENAQCIAKIPMTRFQNEIQRRKATTMCSPYEAQYF